MTNHDDADPVGELEKRSEDLKAIHETVREGERFKGAAKHLDRIAQSFLRGVQLVGIASSRDPLSKHSLLLYSLDDLVESSAAIPVLATSGIFGPLRRDLRYMLETAVKLVYVDQQHKRGDPLEDRIAFFGDTTKVPRSSISPVDQLSLPMLADPEDFKSSVKSTFGELSGFVHPSKRQIEERQTRLRRGEFSGFEGPIVVEKFNDLSSKTLDMVFALVLHGAGTDTAGDVFTVALDDEDRWKFHTTKFTSQVSAYFDYKAERN